MLFRTNVQSEAFEAALADRGIGVPGARRTPGSSPARDVRKALVLLRGGARAADPGMPMPESVRDILRSAGWTEHAAGGPRREPRALGRAAGAGLARRRARGRTADGRRPPTVADLVAELDERAAAQHAPTVEGVTLASLHAAKGLEWDAVFLVGLSDGLLPTVAGADGRGRRRGAAPALRRHHACARAPRSCRTRAPATRGPGRAAACRGSSPTCGPTSVAGRACPRRDLDDAPAGGGRRA